ncbi:MAG: hypothetical protein QXE05_00585 [Nitrososphaeria archaeon]
MPVILAEKVNWSNSSKVYYVTLTQLYTLLPHLKVGDSLSIQVLEVRNERKKIIKRFKPKRETVKVSSLGISSAHGFYLTFSSEKASELNIANNYYVHLLIVEHNGKALLPFELKYLGPSAEETAKNFDKIDVSLISVTQSELQETVHYLLEANAHDKEGDIEATRTDLRKALEALAKIREKVKAVPGKETEDFGKRLEHLIKGIKSFVDYGGPHLGPSPEPTTEMVFNMTVEVVKMISQNLLEGNIEIISQQGQ